MKTGSRHQTSRGREREGKGHGPERRALVSLTHSQHRHCKILHVQRAENGPGPHTCPVSIQPPSYTLLLGPLTHRSVLAPPLQPLPKGSTVCLAYGRVLVCSLKGHTHGHLGSRMEGLTAQSQGGIKGSCRCQEPDLTLLSTPGTLQLM